MKCTTASLLASWWVKCLLIHLSSIYKISFPTAATPAYFFTPPQAGHNFFFSELLRSLVQKRKADELTAAIKSKAIPKKARKPTYQYQKPLETEWKRQKLNEGQMKLPCDSNENDDPKMNSPNLNNENSQDSVINVDSPPAPALPIAQPNSSAFYPYVDPLHFFIDLRVSAGDRKKEAYLHQALKNNNILLDSNTWSNPIISKNRVGSAFKVPGSTREPHNNYSAMNLVNHDQSSKFYPKHQSASVSPCDKNDEDIDIDEKSDHSKRSDWIIQRTFQFIVIFSWLLFQIFFENRISISHLSKLLL